MIELIVLNYLSDTLDVPVFVEEQIKKTDKYVLIEKIGGNAKNHINYATIAIKSHANTLLEAAVLNEKVKEAMENIISLNTVSKSELNTDYNFTNTTKKQYRYQAVYDLVFYI